MVLIARLRNRSSSVHSTCARRCEPAGFSDHVHGEMGDSCLGPSHPLDPMDTHHYLSCHLGAQALQTASGTLPEEALASVNSRQWGDATAQLWGALLTVFLALPIRGQGTAQRLSAGLKG